jgi:hypothetical protein
MVNYLRWVERAVAFTQRLRSFPGEIRITAELGKPVSRSEIETLNKRLRLPLPVSIVEFLTAASSHCNCEYWWEPPKELQTLLEELFPSNTFIFGGASLCDISQFENNGRGCYDTGEAMAQDFPGDSVLWLNSVPFYEQGNGDYLGLYVGSDLRSRDYPVVYLDHDGSGFSRVLAASFDEFLEAWEDLDYIHPFFLREFFLDAGSEHINPKIPKKEQLTALFRRAGGMRTH